MSCWEELVGMVGKRRVCGSVLSWWKVIFGGGWGKSWGRRSLDWGERVGGKGECGCEKKKLICNGLF